jgi:hypothetical protein
MAEITIIKYNNLFKNIILNCSSIIIIIFPFLFLLFYFEPVTIFGKSIYAVVPVGLILLFYLQLLLSKKTKLLMPDFIVMCTLILSCMIFLLREWTYGEQLIYSDVRYIVTTFIFLSFSCQLFLQYGSKRFITYAVIIQSIGVALLGTINFYIFPNVMISYDDVGSSFLNLEGERTRELLLGSSFSANHILCGMFVLLSAFRYKVIELHRGYFILVQLFLMLSIFNTFSRYATLVSIFLLFFSILILDKQRIKYIFISTLVIFAFIAVALYSDIPIYNYFSRFAQNSGGRYEKLQAIFTLISHSPIDFLIGSSMDLISSTNVNGFVISDNSYGLIATSFGVPFMLFFFISMLYVLIKKASDNISIFMFFYIFIGFALTNCILWDPWLFTVLISFVIVSCYGRKPIHDGDNQLTVSFER